MSRWWIPAAALGESDDHIRSGIEQIRDEWANARLGRYQRVVVTHGHVDHYGGLGAVRDQTHAPVAVHESIGGC
jgi:glyoxylase-like metal-dependent hydrolase (beta-lactamase superfamily II)